MLTTADLREIDEKILTFLREGRVTPAYARGRLVEELVGEDEDEDSGYSRGYVQQRLARLEEHGHVVNLLDTGLYQLVDDPKEHEERRT